MSENPYQPAPLQESIAPPVQPGGVAASQNKRFVNFLVDVLCYYMGTFVVGFAIGVVAAIGGIAEPVAAIVASLAGFPVFFGYFIVLEATTGKTLGKLVTGTRVVRVDGGKPTFLQILGRTASRIIPLEPFSFLFGDNTTGWHDTLSGTKVIDERAR